LEIPPFDKPSFFMPYFFMLSGRSTAVPARSTLALHGVEVTTLGFHMKMQACAALLQIQYIMIGCQRVSVCGQVR
jgi:hypothetical protein